MSKTVALEVHLANISELANILLLVALEVHLVLRQTNQHWRLIFEAHLYYISELANKYVKDL